MSDARRLSLKRLGREPDALEHEVEAFRARNDVGETMRVEAGRASNRRLGIPPRSTPLEATWLREEDDLEARMRWPMWAAGLAVDESFADRAARMERSLRKRRAEGDGPIVVVTLDFEHFVRWCEESGYDPADRRSRGSYMHADERRAVAEQRWPPGRNEPCWCGGGPSTSAAAARFQATVRSGPRPDAGRAVGAGATGRDRGRRRVG
jgi:hypothetical protein